MADRRDDFNKHCEEHGVYTYPVAVPRLDKVGECIAEVGRLLEWNAHDCECYEVDGEKQVCSSCELREKARKIMECLEVEHKTLHPDRLGSASEEIFLKYWQKQQERSPRLNGGYGALELILSPIRQDTVRSPLWAMGGKYKFVPPVSQRDAEVAATLMQWLGTACGRGFISECERKIAEVRELQNGFRHHVQQSMRMKPIDPPDQVHEIATEIASKYLQPGTDKFERLRKEISAAIDYTHK